MPEFRAILTYHSLDDSGSVVSTAPSIFRSQMRNLFERGIPSVSPAELLSCPKLDAAHPAVSLTFDDGFDNFYTEAFPLLAEYNMRSTVFLVADRLGKPSDWGRQPASHRSRELMSWSRVEELHRAGVEFGAHTLTHPRLAELSDEAARTEILESKARIEDRLGAPVRCFAYPYGSESPGLRGVVAETFEIGCSTRLGYLRPDSPRESLERIDAYYLQHPFWFRRLFRSVTRSYLASRAFLRSWNPQHA